MADTRQKGPFVLEVKAGTYAWCGCKETGDAPFCDGTHEKL
jgi:CDGSH-type Zn-finger protein